MYRESLNGTRYDPKTVRRTKTVFTLPLKLKEPSKIFTSSLTDFFHEAIDEYRDEAWAIIKKCPQHTFQILTKRPERIMGHLPKDWNDEPYKNVLFGTSIGSQDAIQRVRDLITLSLRTPARIFLSVEPMYGPVDLTPYYFRGRGFDHLPSKSRTEMVELVDWVIVGGESGNENGKYKYRPCELEWIESIVMQCKKAKVPVFVKQFGTHLSKKMGMKDRHGGDIAEWPVHLQIREFPKQRI
jgi:protein gp37